MMIMLMGLIDLKGSVKMTFWEIALLFVIFVITWHVCNLIFLVITGIVQRRQREILIDNTIGHALRRVFERGKS